MSRIAKINGIPVVNTTISAFTYNNTNTLTILDSVGDSYYATINSVTGLTFNGDATFNQGNIINPDFIQFNTTYTGNTTVEGRMYWDEPNGTVSLGMHGSNVSQQIGLEQYYYVKNQSGATIENGRVVRAAGTLGASSRILGEYMIADGSIPAKFTLGIATEDIINGDDGYVTEFGVVRNINTTGSLYGETWNDGDVLWVSPTISGGLTKFEPSTPNLKIEMAIVLDAASNGSIFVRPNRYPSIRDLQEVKISGSTNLDILQYDSNLGYWTHTNTPSLISVSANTFYGTTFSGGTFYGDGSNLTGVGNFTGFTITDGTNNQSITNGNTISFLANSGLTTTVSPTDVMTIGYNLTGMTSEPTPTNGDKLLIFDTSSGLHKNIDWSQLPGSSGGEANTASNIGGGNGIFAQKVGVDLQFRSLVAGSNITITSGATELTISSTGGGGGSSRITGSTITTGTTLTTVDTIDTMKDNATNIIEVYVKAYQTSAAQWGVWKRTLTVTKVSGTVTIREENADVDKQSTGLRANSLSFSVSGGNILIEVTGIAATTIGWESAYEIIL